MSESKYFSPEQDARLRYLVCLMSVSALLGSSLIAFLIGLHNNRDVAFEIALGFFFAGFLVTAIWSRTSKRARWLLVCLIGLTILMGVQYARFRRAELRALERARERFEQLRTLDPSEVKTDMPPEQGPPFRSED